VKIAHILPDIPMPAAGSQDTSVPELAQAIAGLGHEVTIYGHRGSPALATAEAVAPAVTAESAPAAAPEEPPPGELSRHVAAFARRLAERWSQDPPDVAHAHSVTGGLAALAAARGHGIQVVQTLDCRDGIAQRQRAGRGAPRGSRAEAAIARNVDLNIAPCADQARRIADLGVPRTSVRVVPGGIDTAEFTPDGPAAGRNGMARLVTAMPLADTWGLANLTYAIAHVPDAELLIVGGPPASRLEECSMYGKISKAAARLGIADRVTFTGQMDRAARSALLRSADLMVGVSPPETHGTGPVEAMACGTPVLTLGSGCFGDAVADRATGVVIPAVRPGLLTKKIRELLASPTLIHGYAIAAADRASSRFSWNRIAGETVAAYGKARGGVPGSGATEDDR
jgi:glycosyltransferase involved in cell wall biosynthesis